MRWPSPQRRSALRYRTLTLVVVLVSLAALASGGRAFAHADLDSTDPPAGSVVDESPSQILFRFTGAVDSVPGGIRVVTAGGTEVELGQPERFEGSTSTIVVNLPELSDGTYVVAWRAISADSHPIAGAFTFSVGISSDPAPGLIDSLLEGDRQLGGASDVLAAGRWAGYVGLALALGVLIAGICIAAPVASTQFRRTVVGGIVIASVGTLMMIAAQAAITVNRWAGATGVEAWRDALGTNAGRWWAARFAAVVVVGVGGVSCYTTLARRRSAAAGFVVACIVTFAIVAAGGHAVSGRTVVIGFAATVAHLGAMTIWVGGLIIIALTRGDERVHVARRFSPIAFAAVVVLVGTGLTNAWRQVGTFNGLTDTSFGRWLLVKTVIVVIVVGIAGTARSLLVHTIHTDHESDSASPMRRLVLVELVGITVAIAATAFLVNSPPARAVAIGPASMSVVNDQRIAQVTLDPARAGGTTMHVYITGPTILDEPDEIIVQISLPERGIGPIEIDTTRVGPSHVTNPNAVFPFPGTWTVEVRARYGDFNLVTFKGQLVVR